MGGASDVQAGSPRFPGGSVVGLGALACEGWRVAKYEGRLPEQVSEAG